jgi:hypothetical protein
MYTQEGKLETRPPMFQSWGLFFSLSSFSRAQNIEGRVSTLCPNVCKALRIVLQAMV